MTTDRRAKQREREALAMLAEMTEEELAEVRAGMVEVMAEKGREARLDVRLGIKIKRSVGLEDAMDDLLETVLDEEFSDDMTTPEDGQ